MGDHFVLLVDRLLTESTLEAAIESKNRLEQVTPLSNKDNLTEFSFCKMDENNDSSWRELEQCRICHDEDESSNMEMPCSCCGSLKYAHRKCIQRWCNVKGDTICEICHQPFKPGYTAPPPLFHYSGIPMNFRGNWEISRGDLHNSRFIAMVTSDQDFPDSDFEDFSPSNSRSLICCRIIAIIFIALLVLRHTLPIVINGSGDYSFTLFMLLFFRTVGILLPIYIMFKAFTVIQRRRHQQDLHFSPAASDELPQFQPPRSPFIYIR